MIVLIRKLKLEMKAKAIAHCDLAEKHSAVAQTLQFNQLSLANPPLNMGELAVRIRFVLR